MPRVRNFTGVSKGERQFFNYEFTSVLTGRAFVTYYIGYAQTPVLLPYVFVTSDDNYAKGGINEGAVFVLETTINFDSNVEKTNTIQGEAFCKAYYGVTTANGAGEVYPIYKLQRVRGSSVTGIGTIQLPTDITGAPTEKTMMLTCAKTTLIKGDVLRLVLELWHRLGAGTFAYVFYFDPEDASGKDSLIKIPFVVDV